MTFKRSLKAVRVLVLVLLSTLPGIGLSEENARRELQKRNVRFNANAFVEHAAQGDLDIVKLFISAGMKPNVRNKDGRSALHVAARENHAALVNALLAKGADVNAGSKGERENGKTALMFAAQMGHAAVVQSLLDKGANVNESTDYGKTALMFAAEYGHAAIAQVLLDKGADVNATAQDGKTALRYAATKGHTSIVELLKKAGAKN